jgi:hypothetical protein
VRIRNKNQYLKKSKGITIVEVLFILFIFSLIAASFYTLFAKGSKYIIESKRQLGATSVASERMEIVRSLDYGQIGIAGSGYINGDIPASDEVTVGNQTFHVFSSVVYIDDGTDGIEGEDPDDDRPADYKRVIIKVAWRNDENTNKSVVLTSDFAPPGVEGSTTGGSLIVKVVDKDSVGIEDFDVHIVNSDLSIDESFETDQNGGVSLPGMPVDGNDYEISISKSDYFSIDTFPAYPTQPIYYFDEDLNSGVGGENSIGEVSYGDFTFAFSDTGGNFEFVKMSPANSTVNDARMFFVEPGETVSQEAIFSNKSLDSTLVTVLDSNDFSPIEGASVRLYNLSLPQPYDVTLQTDKFGLAFFPEAMPALAVGDYSIDIQAAGYTSKTDTVSVSGYIKKEITLDVI